MKIYPSLHGNIDFSILKSEGFNNIESIIFENPGEVTSIINLPNKLKKLHCSQQYLIQIDNIPQTLKELYCDYNYISHLDLSKLGDLQILQISNNKFEEIDNLPESLEELYCNNNNIKLLDLENLSLLRVLHTSNNKTIIIKNLPPSIVDFKSENNPYIEVQHANLHESGHDDENDAEIKIDYIQSINDYFKLKDKYENDLFKNKKKAFEKAPTKKLGRKNVEKVIPKCLNCGKPGGTIFSRKKHTYYAVCGNPVPCNLKIEIYNGIYSMNSSILLDTYKDLNIVKSNIIKQKLDTIFYYISTQTSAKLFKEYLEEFTYENSSYIEFFEKYNKIYKDDIKEEKIKRKNQQIYELIHAIKQLVLKYEETGNTDLLQNAIEIQKNELNPEIHNLRMLKYEIMEMELVKMNKSTIKDSSSDINILGDDSSESNEGYNGSSLVQKYTSLQNMGDFINTPKVVKFTKL